MNNADLIKLNKSHIDKVSLLLADSFFDNPLMTYFFEDEHIRKKVLPKIFRVVANSMMIIGDVYATSENLEGVIGLRRPNKTKANFMLYSAIIKNIYLALPSLRYILSKSTILKIKNMNINGYPNDYKNYFTIEMVAVDKNYRGQKLMSKMIRFCLNEVNKSNGICLLQTETEVNCSKYQHLGFSLLNKSETVVNKVYSYILIYNSKYRITSES